MTNLEYAQEICDQAKKRVEGYPAEVRLAVDLLEHLIQDNRELRAQRNAVAATMNYSKST